MAETFITAGYARGRRLQMKRANGSARRPRWPADVVPLGPLQLPPLGGGSGVAVGATVGNGVGVGGIGVGVGVGDGVAVGVGVGVGVRVGAGVGVGIGVAVGVGVGVTVGVSVGVGAGSAVGVGARATVRLNPARVSPATNGIIWAAFWVPMKNSTGCPSNDSVPGFATNVY